MITVTKNEIVEVVKNEVTIVADMEMIEAVLILIGDHTGDEEMAHGLTEEQTELTYKFWDAVQTGVR